MSESASAAAGRSKRVVRPTSARDSNSDYVFQAQKKHRPAAAAASSQPAAASSAAASSSTGSAALDADPDSEDEISEFVRAVDGLDLTQPTQAAPAQEPGASDPDQPPALEPAPIPIDNMALGQELARMGVEDQMTEEERLASDPTEVQFVDPFGDSCPSNVTFISFLLLLKFVEEWATSLGFAVRRRSHAVKPKPARPDAAGGAAAAGNAARPGASAAGAAAAAGAADGDAERLAEAAVPATEPLIAGGTFYCHYRGAPTEGVAVGAGERPRGPAAQHRQTVRHADCKFAINFSRHASTGLYYVNKRNLTHTHHLHPPCGTKERPLIITSLRQITDAMAASVETWIGLDIPQAYHMRCRWHIAMNITRNLSSKLGARFKPFLKAWKAVASKPTPRTFQNAWDKLLVDFPTVATAPPGQRCYLLQEIYPMREQWADAWTNQHCTMGAHSTQRGEVMMSFIKRHLGANSSLLLLFEQLLRSSIHQTDSRNDNLFKQYELPQPAVIWSWNIEI
jgi:hypothetical protein